MLFSVSGLLKNVHLQKHSNSTCKQEYGCHTGFLCSSKPFLLLLFLLDAIEKSLQYQ